MEVGDPQRASTKALGGFLSQEHLDVLALVLLASFGAVVTEVIDYEEPLG